MRIAIAAQQEYFSSHIPRAIGDHEVRFFNTTIQSSHQDFAGLAGFDAELNILFRPEFVPLSVLTELDGLKIGISSEPFPKLIEGKLHYSEDSLGRFRTFLPALEMPYDYIFHYDELSESFLKKQGVTLSGFFPLPVIPAPELVPQGRPIDILFLGRSTPHREKMMGSLKRDFDLVHIAHGLHGPEVSDFLYRARIVLNIHAEDEISWEPRIQLALAHQKLVISEAIGPNSILQAGRDFIEVRDQAELVQTCCDVLANGHRFLEVSKAGYDAVKRKLDAESCYSSLIEQVSPGGNACSFSRDKDLLDITPLLVACRYNGMDHLITKWLNNV